jgi:hypothetical protein
MGEGVQAMKKTRVTRRNTPVRKISVRVNGCVLSPDWKPSHDDIIYGINLGFTQAQVASMAEDMKLWALANKNRAVARKADWHLTFLGWMRRQQHRLQKFYRPHEKGYAELAEDIRNDYGAGPYEGQRDSEPDLFGTSFCSNQGSGRHH